MNKKKGNWMEILFQTMLQKEDPKLKISMPQLLIPGTHHSGVNQLMHINKIFKPWAVCQNLSVQQQFMIGVRFFHFAVSDDCSDGQIYIKHYFRSRLFKDEIKSLRGCLEKNKKEIIIVYVKKDSNSQLSKQGIKKIIQVINTEFERIGFLQNKYIQKNILQWYKAESSPGRVVLSGFKFIQKQFKQKYVWYCPNSYRQTKSDNALTLKENIINYINNEQWNNKTLLNLECIITLNVRKIIQASTIWKQTFRFKPIFHQMLDNSQEMIIKSNIIMIDYVCEQDTERIINLNYEKFKLKND